MGVRDAYEQNDPVHCTKVQSEFARNQRVLDIILTNRLMISSSPGEQTIRSRRQLSLIAQTKTNMKILTIGFRVFSALAISIFAIGCTNGQQSKENLLATAGFRNVLATTPQQKTLLAQLPPNQISTVQKDGKTWFVFPNQASGSAMVGTQAQYTQYRQLAFAQKISDQNLQAAQLNSMPPVGWGAWGGMGWGWR